LCRHGTVITLVKPASTFLFTAVADKRCLLCQRAVVVERLEIGTVVMAMGTVPAFPFAHRGIDITEVLPVAVLSQCTAIRLFVISVMLLKNTVLLDFFGDGGGILAKLSRNGTHTSA